MRKGTRVLGVYTTGHDAGACLFDDGRLVYSIEAERVTRVKHEYLFPPAISDLVRHTGISLRDIDYVAVGTTVHPDLLGIPDLQSTAKRIAAGALHVETTCSLDGHRPPCIVIAHEACHAALACHYGRNPRAPTLVLANQGRGTLGHSALLLQRGDALELLDRDPLPWYGCGFGWIALGCALGYGKGPSVASSVMAMAGHGRYSEAIAESLLEVDPELMRRPRPEQESIIRRSLAAPWLDGSFERGAHLVATYQHLFTETVQSYVLRELKRADVGQLALTGGCALNVICNSAIRAAIDIDLAIPPAPNDAGIALGAALYAQRYCLGISPEPVSVFANGPEPTTGEIAAAFALHGVSAHAYDQEVVAATLANGGVVAYFEGKAEIGPRALGHRSLLGNPARAGMRQSMSEVIKGRQWYRPLAPVMRLERFQELFPAQPPSPYMSFTHAASHAGIPEAVHADGTACVQTLTPSEQPRLHRLLQAFEAHTGVPGLINTSLKRKGKAIAHTCADVLDDFRRSEVALFVMGDLMGENSRHSRSES